MGSRMLDELPSPSSEFVPVILISVCLCLCLDFIFDSGNPTRLRRVTAGADNIGTRPRPRPVNPSSGRGVRYQVPSPATPFECSVMWGQPASPGPFNLWMLRAAVDTVVGLSAPPEVGSSFIRSRCVICRASTNGRNVTVARTDMALERSNFTQQAMRTGDTLFVPVSIL